MEVKTFPATNNMVGIDLGLKDFLVASNEETVPNPKYYRHYETKLQKAQRKLSKRKKRSKNKGKQRFKVARIHEKIANTRLDLLHKVSTKLVKENQLICYESLKVNNMLKNHKINLAKGMVTMVYKASSDTNELTLTLNLTNVFPQDRSVFSINPDRREVQVDGTILNFSGKERDLMMLLYRNRNKAVSYEDIKIELWPERSVDNDANLPDVGNDEINALVYRLRKRLGKHRQKVVTVTRYGVLLELD